MTATARSNQVRRAGLGVLALLIMAAAAGLIWDSTAGVAALCFGALAVMIQLFAGRLASRRDTPATPDHMASYLVGMALRVMGIALIWAAVTIDRAAFPPGAAAVGYLGTLLPLLWLETRLT